MTTDFGTRLRELRHQRGSTLRDAAERIGLHFTSLSKIEHGHEQAGETTIRKLAAVLGGNPEELLALAGKVPAELHERAAEDVRFAMLLRVLPMLDPVDMLEIYRVAGVRPDNNWVPPVSKGPRRVSPEASDRALRLRQEMP